MMYTIQDIMSIVVIMFCIPITIYVVRKIVSFIKKLKN